MSGGGGGTGSVHVRLAQTAPSRMSSTLTLTLARQAKDSSSWEQECGRDPAERSDLLGQLKMGPGFLPPTLRLKEHGAFLQLKG